MGLAVSFEQRNGGLQTLNGFPAGSALPIRLGKLRAEGDEPLALTVNLRGDFQLHGKRLTLFGSRHNGGEDALNVDSVARDNSPGERRDKFSRRFALFRFLPLRVRFLRMHAEKTTGYRSVGEGDVGRDNRFYTGLVNRRRCNSRRGRGQNAVVPFAAGRVGIGNTRGHGAGGDWTTQIIPDRSR